MKAQLVLLIALILSLASCNPRVATSILKESPPQVPEAEISVFDKDDLIAEKVEILGSIKVGDAGMTVNCGYDRMMNLMKEEARKMGGNAIKIVRHTPPDFLSSCHRFEAEVLLIKWGEEVLVKNPEPLITERNQQVRLEPDLIVFTNSDSIYCTILNVKSNGILYSFKNEKGEFSSTAPIHSIQNYVKNYNRPDIAAAELKKKEYSVVRFNLYGAYSYTPGKIDESYSDFYIDYLKGLKHGWHAGADICFFLSETYGLGIKYSQFFSNSFYGNVYVEVEDETFYGNLSNNIGSTFIGPYYSARVVFPKKGNTLYMNLGLGYLDYSNESEMITDTYILSGKTLGTALDIGYDFFLNKHLALGFQLSSVSGVLSEVEQEEGGVVSTYQLEGEEMIGLGRLDFSASLKFNF